MMKRIKIKGRTSVKTHPEEKAEARQLTVQEFSVKHGHSRHASNELEIGEVVLIAQARVGVDLQGVVVPAAVKPEGGGSSGRFTHL